MLPTGFPCYAEKRGSKGKVRRPNKIEKCPPRVSRVGTGPAPVEQDYILSTKTAD